MQKNPHNLDFACMIMGSGLAITTQEKHLEVRKVTFIQLLTGCSLAIKKKKKDRRREQKALFCHCMNPLNDSNSEVMFTTLIPYLEKDIDNWRMLRGGCKGE